MKKYLVICAAMAVAVSLTSCKSKQAQFDDIFKRAEAAELEDNQRQNDFIVEEVAVVQAPVVEKPTVEAAPVVEENVAVRNENVIPIDGANLKAYSVVVGSFGVKANADRLQATLISNGYNAQIVRSAATNTYRVVAATSDSKSEAANWRNQLRSQYPDAWLLGK